MKVVDLVNALEGVPEALRSAASSIRGSEQAAEALEKTASRARLRASLRMEEDTDEDDFLSALAEEDLEKVAARSTRRIPLGEVSEEDASPERLTRDADFLTQLRNF